MTITIAEEKISQSIIVKPPNFYKVVLNNDNFTPMDFVIDLLMHTFHHSVEDATAITEDIHTKGKGTAGLFSYEIADQKATETVSLSRSNGFPLVATIEVA